MSLIPDRDVTIHWCIYALHITTFPFAVSTQIVISSTGTIPFRYWFVLKHELFISEVVKVK